MTLIWLTKFLKCRYQYMRPVCTADAYNIVFLPFLFSGSENQQVVTYVYLGPIYIDE